MLEGFHAMHDQCRNNVSHLQAFRGCRPVPWAAPARTCVIFPVKIRFQRSVHDDDDVHVLDPPPLPSKQNKRRTYMHGDLASWHGGKMGVIVECNIQYGGLQSWTAGQMPRPPQQRVLSCGTKDNTADEA